GKEMITLLNSARIALSALLEKSTLPLTSHPHPGCILFFSASNRQERAHVLTATGKNFDEAWQNGESLLLQWVGQQSLPATWLRVDIVRTIEPCTWHALQNQLRL